MNMGGGAGVKTRHKHGFPFQFSQHERPTGDDGSTRGASPRRRSVCSLGVSIPHARGRHTGTSAIHTTRQYPHPRNWEDVEIPPFRVTLQTILRPATPRSLDKLIEAAPPLPPPAPVVPKRLPRTRPLSFSRLFLPLLFPRGVDRGAGSSPPHPNKNNNT